MSLDFIFTCTILKHLRNIALTSAAMFSPYVPIKRKKPALNLTNAICFAPSCGVPQGSILSPCLLGLYSDFDQFLILYFYCHVDDMLLFDLFIL